MADKFGKCLVFSYEGFGALTEIGLQKFRSFALEYATVCDVVYYVRNPMSYAVSALSQRVKMGRKAWCEDDLPIQYHEDILNLICRVFGFDNCHVRLYDRSALADGNVIVDLTGQIPIEKSVTFEIYFRLL